MPTKQNVLILLLMLTTFANCIGQSIQLSEKSTVSILTCGLGNETYSYFGHTAVRIQDPINQLDLVYNYGAFDFATPNFVARFAKGDLQYYVVAYPFYDFIQEYNREQRSVFEQELQLTLALKQKLLDRLNTTLQSDERFYTYKFIDRNCTSMIVDLLNETLESTIITKKTNTDISYRSVLYPYFEGHFFEKLGVNIIFGTKVDQLATQLFLPFELLESIKTSRYQNQLLSKPTVELIHFEKATPFSWWTNGVFYGLFLILVIVSNKKFIYTFYLSVMGVLGIFFVFMGFYSLHPELEFNYNILLFNPSLLMVVLLQLRKEAKATQWATYFNYACLFLFTALLINKAPVLIVVPLILTTTIVLFRLNQMQKQPNSSRNL